MNVSIGTNHAPPNQKGYSCPLIKMGNRQLTMSVKETSSFIELFRATPAKSLLLAFGPLVLAVGQLANSYVNGISPVVSIGFAVTMIAFAVVATDHHAAEHRRRRLEADIDLSPDVRQNQ